ncbi:hypothetical protein HPB49_011612 [Dermacentor silvarum]|uniref:Uncharacterized protein n=1 Tax=Dermacentor silvarum TaxID=543639 RepID=A0ACB8DP83_DERSI|nr:hypothetical protein HPB49_011612 [Dermacentor silvarum]
MGHANALLAHLRSRDVQFYRDYLRMPPRSLDTVLEVLKPRIQKTDTNYRKAIPPEHRLLLAVSRGLSSSKIAAENQRFSNIGSEFSPQSPPHQSQTSGLGSTSASSAIQSETGSMASKPVDEAASVAALATEACGGDAGDVQYCNPWLTGPASCGSAAAEDQRAAQQAPHFGKRHSSRATDAALSSDEMALQWHIYGTAFGLRVKQRNAYQGFSSHVQASASSSAVLVLPGRKEGVTGQPSLPDACCPKPPKRGSSISTSANSSFQQQLPPTPCCCCSSHGGNRPVLIPATAKRGFEFKQVSAADKVIYDNHPLPRSPISENHRLHLSALSPLSAASTQASRCVYQSQCGAQSMVAMQQRGVNGLGTRAAQWVPVYILKQCVIILFFQQQLRQA